MHTLPAPVIRSVETFAKFLTARELPGLPQARADATLPFIVSRCQGLPSITRFGVGAIAGGFSVVMRLPGGNKAAAWLSDHPLPILGEYPRLIRSLTFAYVFETWPDSRFDGSVA